jgi:hypothetical protein
MLLVVKELLSRTQLQAKAKNSTVAFPLNTQANGEWVIAWLGIGPAALACSCTAANEEEALCVPHLSSQLAHTVFDAAVSFFVI